MRRRTSTDSYCDVIVREKGIAEKPDLTIEVEYSFNREMNEAIKEKCPYYAWWFDADAEPKVWRVHPRYQILIERLAVEMFDCARRIEGEIITDLKTGNTFEQKSLF